MNLPPLGALIQGASNARNSYVTGQQQGRDRAFAEAMARHKQQQADEEAKIKAAFVRAQTEKLLQPPAPTVRNIDPLSGPGVDAAVERDRRIQQNKPLSPKTAPTQRQTDRGIEEWNPETGDWVVTGRKPYQAPPTEGAPTIVAGVNPDGTPLVFRVPKTSGPATPVEGMSPKPDAGLNRGTAAIHQKIAANRTQAAKINSAIEELKAHPKAVGLRRMTPDWINQRFDEEGIGTRADIANVGSLVIHDRSGAAVTVSEFERLKPFIPSIRDSSEAIAIKLKKLLEGIETETRLLQENIANGTVKDVDTISGSGSSGDIDLRDGGQGGGRGGGGGRTITVNGKTFRVNE